MNRKTLLIIAGAAVLVAIVGIIFISTRKNPATTPTAENTPATSTGQGGVTNVNSSPTTTGRGDLKVTVDPTKPFATVTPRAEEPTQSSGSSSQGSSGNQVAFNNYQQALDNGLIPDQNGNYKQVVSPTGYTPYEQQQIQQYQSNSDLSYINSIYGAGTVQNEIQNGLSVNTNVAPVVDATTASIPLVTDIDQTAFTTSSDNSAAGMKSYINQLSLATQDFDLVNDPDLVNLIYSGTDDTQFQSASAQAKYVQAAILKIPVPAQLLGFSEMYVKLYDRYQYWTDQIVASDQDPASSITVNPSDALNELNGLVSDIKDSIPVASQIIKNAQ